MKNKHFFDDAQLIINFNLTFSNGKWIDSSITFSSNIYAINIIPIIIAIFSNSPETSNLNIQHNNGNNNLNNNDNSIIINEQENIPFINKGKYI